MSFQAEFQGDPPGADDLRALKELADLLWEGKRDIAAEWTRRLVRTLPQYFADGATYEPVLVDLNEGFLATVLGYLQQGDVAQLYATYYEMNRLLIEGDLRETP